MKLLVSGLLALLLLCAPAAARASDVWALDVMAASLSPCPPADSPECEPPVDDSTVAGLTAPTAPNGAGWYRTLPVRATLTGHDGSGPVTMDYQLGTAPVQTGQADPTSFDFNADGQWVLKTQAVDVGATGSGWTTFNVKIDTNTPSNGTVVPAGWSATSVPITVQGSDGSGSGVAQVEWKLDGSAVQSTASLVVAGDGDHVLETRVVDAAGNASVWRTDHVKIDSTVPVDATGASGSWYMGTSAPVTITGTDDRSGVASVQWVLDGVAGSAPGSSYTLNVAGSGEHALSTQVIDSAGNASGWTDRTIRVDSTPPSNLTPVVSPAWRAGDAAVRLDGADGESGLKRMEWSLDGSAAKAEVGGTTIAVSGTGAHLLRTRAVDVAGHASGWRTDPINIDKVTPTDLTATPPGSAVPSPYQVTVDGDDAHSFVHHVEWKIDGGAVQTGPDGSTFTLSGTGTFSFETRIVDAAGNDSGWRGRSVVVDASLPGGDTTPPVDTTAAPGGWQTGDVPLVLSATDAGVGVKEIRVRGGGQSIDIRPPGTAYPISGDGVHRIETMAVDLNGNKSNWRPHTIKIDSTVPVDDTVIPSGWAAGSFRLAAHDPSPGSGIANIEWEIDSGPTGFGPPDSDVPLADGVYVIRHRAVDQAGQVSAWVEGTLKTDSGVPVNTTATPPSGWILTAWTTTPTGTDALSGFDHGEWRLDGGTTRTGDITLDVDGAHLLETRAVDVAGKVSAWRSDNVQVDVNAPTDTTPAAPAEWRNTPWSVTPTAGDGLGSGVASLQWKLGSAGSPSSAFPVVISADGVTTFYTHATDVAGHVSAWRPHVVKIDTVAPAVALDCGDGSWRTTAATCTTSADGGPSELATLLVSGAGSPYALAAGAPVVVEADGVWPIALDAVDGAGNAAQATGSVRVDRTPPSPALACAAAAAPLGWDCTVSATDATSGVASVSWRVGGGAWQTPAAGGAFSLPHGTVEVAATDVAGNVAVSVPSVLADRTPPAVAPPPPAPAPPADTPPVKLRSRSVVVTLDGSHGLAGMLGAFELRTLQSAGGSPAAAADVRPLSLGAGRYRVTVQLTSGQLTAKRVRTVRFRTGGTTPRMGVALTGVKQIMRARLTVERRTARGWKRIALATTSMKP